ncbi:MAG: 3-deoxy-7-phosphoheptulonate synthase [Gemmatimonadota bacterium]
MIEHSHGSTPTRHVDRPVHPAGSIIMVGDVPLGGPDVIVIAGPCAVESRTQLLDTARGVADAGAHILRGGAFKPRTSPYSFRGLREEGLELLAEARTATGLPVVTEVLDPRQVELVGGTADMFQIGSRSMQNFALLEEMGRVDRPVLLKRGMSSTVDELLFAAEYILAGGNDRVVLCERGIRTFATSTRNTLDLNAVPLLKRLTHLPVIVDPSHGTGHAWMVPQLARGAVAVGADGLLIEVHADPGSALSDGEQSLTVPAFRELMPALAAVASAVGRSVLQPVR